MKYNLLHPDRMLAILLFVFWWFLFLVIALAVIMMLPLEYENFKYTIGAPFSLILTITIYTMFSNPFEIKKIQELIKRERDNSQLTISIIYSKFIKRVYLRIVVSLIISLVIISITCAILKLTYVAIFIDLIVMFYCFLLLMRNYLINTRVKNGIFGTNAEEAKELIKFILQNSEDIDFNDQNGKLREVFSPETILVHKESYLPNLGEVNP